MTVKSPPLGAKPKIRLSIPPLVWHIVDLVMTVALTAAVTLVIMVANGLLVAKSAPPAGRQGSLGPYEQGFDVWLGFIARPDILGTMIVTALVAAVYFSWRYRHKD